jgi:uncharacterized protein (TIGR03437 family)
VGIKQRMFWALAAGAAVPALLWALSGGPEPGLTGAPGELNCTRCHLGFPLNDPGGSVTVSFPGGMQYTPGVTQRLTVTVTDARQSRFGFQLSARLASDTARQAGSFSPIDNTTRVICSTPPFFVETPPPCPANVPLQFISHSLEGVNRGLPTYELNWTPPGTDVGPVTLYVSGNAANGDFSIAGDRIYTRSFTVAPAAGAPPTISQAVNGASFQPVISGASWVTVTGTNLASTTRVWRADEIVDGALPTSLDGVSVSVNNRPAAVFFISPEQVNVLPQPDDTTGPVPVTVTNAAGTSTTFTAQMQPLTPAFFPWEGKYAVATRTDFTLVGPPGLFPGLDTAPARPGEVVILWGTGFGPTNPPTPANRVITGAHALAAIPSVRIGGLPAEVIGAALSPGSAGLTQLAVRVPELAPSGDLAVVAEFPGAASPSNVFLTVQR